MVGTKKQNAFIVFRKGRVCWNLVYVEKVVYVESFDLQFFFIFFSSDFDSDV